MTLNENCTLQRCQSIWHLGIKELTKSTHSGLQRQGRILLQKWSQKEYTSMERTFDLYLERKRGLDEGSLKALKESDNYWSNRTCQDYKQAAEGQKQQAQPEKRTVKRKMDNADSIQVKAPRTGDTTISNEALIISLADFMTVSPKDHGPISFFRLFGPQSSKHKYKWELGYITLYSQALKSNDPDIVSIGREMSNLWKSQRDDVGKYWQTLEHETQSNRSSNSNSQEGGAGSQEGDTLCSSQKYYNSRSTRVLLGPDLPSESFGSDFVGQRPSSARSSINSIDIRFFNRLVGPGQTSSRLSGESSIYAGDENVSERLMAARRSLNFIFTEAFLNEHLSDNMKSAVEGFSISDYDMEEMATLGKVAMTRDRLPTPCGFEEVYEPDFFGERDGFPFIMMEVKKPDAHPDTLDYDVRKLPQIMKLSLNQLVSSGICTPRVIGLLVQERQCEVMVMSLPGEAVYLYQSVGSFQFPEDHKQLGVLAASIGILKYVK
ncbi:hypothetical protein BGZ76_004569, partial [Entomortierella beljakovae]